MEINLLLPISLFMMTALPVLIYKGVAEKSKKIFENKKISVLEAIFIVAFIGLLVIIINFIPSYAIQILFITALSYNLFIFTHLFSRRVVVSIVPPIIFTASFLILNFLLMENILAVILITDIFSVTFAIIAVTLISPLFSWRVMIIFASLLAIMDFIHVFITGSMVEAAGKVVSLSLPLILLLPSISSLKKLTILGLGDIFLSGLLSTHVASRYNSKAGLLTAFSISIVFLIYDVIASNFILHLRAFPATILVLSGFLMGMSPYIFKKRKRT
ncbi:MAG: hypothetical protein QXH24_00735 [Candidatus Bathyarchaeia archaeon]